MLRMSLNIADLVATPRIDGAVIRIGASWLEPLQHRALESVLLLTRDRWLLQVREALPPETSPSDTPASGAIVAPEVFWDWEKRLLAWPLDFILVQARMNSEGFGGALRLQAGDFGVAPIYVARSDDTVHASWDFAEVAGRLRHRLLDVQMTAYVLGRRRPYSARTMFQNVAMLTTGASVIFGPEMQFSYPEAAGATTPKPLRAGADVPGSLGKLIDAALGKRRLQAEEIAVELSGGMDSTCVAALARRRLQAPIFTTCVKVPGAGGEAQLARRRTICAALSRQDFIVDIAQAMPDLSGPGNALVDGHPLAERYFAAFDRLWQWCEESGSTILLTGVGGDELYPQYASEGARLSESGGVPTFFTPMGEAAAKAGFLFGAPRGVIPASGLLSMACQAPPLLRRGLWPVNPLCDPAVMRFCHRLPAEWRVRRRATRELIAAELSVDLFPDGYEKESFGAVMIAAMVAHKAKLRKFFSESVLVEYGIVCHKSLISAVDNLSMDQDLEHLTGLMLVIYTERFLKFSL